MANDNESTEQEIYPFDQEVNGKYIKLTIIDTSSNDGWTAGKLIESAEENSTSADTLRPP